MLKTFDQNTRRILKFPAVLTSQDVNPTTLLQSMINLSHSIMNYHTRFFATQRKNARESIRQITILSMFFSELVEHDLSGLPDSVMLCLCELHHSLQKILYLFEDCTRTGARVLILMKSHFVATQFSSLIRAVATALDVLPLSLMNNVSCEVKELVEMVTKQARKAKMGVEYDDEYTMKRVMLILNQFENRFEPDPIMIKRVLYHLRIDSWHECHKEIMFLDEEISLQLLQNDEREMHLLNTLAGFMRYCRGVLFENNVPDYNNDRSLKPNLEILSCLNPEDFRCPISLELMSDPVTVATGQTYDRVSIKKWLNSGNLICPKTGEKLATTELVPNTNLRKVIQQYCIDHGVSISKFQSQSRDISSTILPGSPACAEAIKFLSEFLVRRLRNGTEKHKSRAAFEIRLLAKSNIYNRFCLIEARAIPPLLKLLSSHDSTTQENAIAGLLKLSKHSNGKNMIIKHDGLNPIINVLRTGIKQESKHIAAATIFYLSSQSNMKLVTDIAEAIPALIDQIKTGSSPGIKNSLAALFGILLHPKNHQPALSYGTIPVLSTLISTSEKPEIVTDSLAVVATLAESFDGSDTIMKALTMPLIIKTLQTSPSRAAKEYCVSILLALCNNLGTEVIRVLANNPNLMGFVYTLSSTGGSQGSKKARSLIRIMHRFNEANSSGLMPNWDSSRYEAVRSC